MVRPMLTAEERARGQRLGAVLRQARGERSMVEVAALAGVPVETLRKIETGRIPTPAFFTVVALAEAVGVPLVALAATADLDLDLDLADTASAPAVLSA
jgi:transcriptional regulator with XRE-family HTH domain